MTDLDAKLALLRYLRTAREAILWKLDGLDEYDARRPLTVTGTNLLGLVKHLSGVEAEYFGLVFGRPFRERLPWLAEDAEPNADMWVRPEESREDVVGLYRRAQAHADETIDALPLDARGTVPWWPEERREVTLHLVLVHVVAEVQRHAGHADILREHLDGSAGLRAGRTNMPDEDTVWWEAYRQTVDDAARAAADRD